MNLEQLNSFIAVARHLNFTKAADSLFVSHSTISRQIKSLEKSLGVRLLIRDNRSVSLTRAGAILLERGEKLFEEIEEIEATVKKAGSGLTGNLMIASLNFYHQPLFDLYKQFTSQYPDIVFSVQHRDVGLISELIDTERADLGIAFSYEFDDYRPDLEVFTLYRDRFCVVVSEDHEFAGRKSIHLRDLQKEKLLFLNNLQFKFFQRFDNALGTTPNRYNDFVQPSSGESMIIQIRSGLGVSVLPRPLALDFRSGCSMLEIDDCDTSFDVLMMWKKNSTNPVLPLFVGMAEEHFPGISERIPK